MSFRAAACRCKRLAFHQMGPLTGTLGTPITEHVCVQTHSLAHIALPRNTWQ
jgi:hypothetical protein